jgi:hypothetical protein
VSIKIHITNVALCTILLALCSPIQGQQPGKIARIGFLAGTEGFVVGAFQRGLRDLGYVEGKNILVEYRYSEGKIERVQSPCRRTRTAQGRCACHYSLASTPRGQASDQNDSHCYGHQCGSGRNRVSRVDSLARPGGNIIGITRLTRELSGKRVQLLISCGYAVRVAFAESISWLTRVGNAHL